MNLTPRPRDLTALLNSDRTDTAIPEPVDTEKPNTAIPNTAIPNTEKPKNRKDEKPESGEGWVKTSVSLRASTRRRLKTWAAAHDMRIQEVLEDALDSYLS
ncbi:chromosome partitioning protein ParA [Bifidobacterium adolescentis]|uniref:chromosome partitioning protein ParA n=1 Tax=Bifidobacterium adolescentis TaxID=1680 RepID=UPI0022E64AC4|nr:chromosome partitioning protein ParA [Bifidobacterium adolescentis]